jgi:hypothetical protein
MQSRTHGHLPITCEYSTTLQWIYPVLEEAPSRCRAYNARTAMRAPALVQSTRAISVWIFLKLCDLGSCLLDDADTLPEEVHP